LPRQKNILKQTKMNRLEGRSIIITGAASGIGRAMAFAFTYEGANVLLVDKDDESLKQVQSELAKSNGRVITMTCDVSNEQEVSAVVSKAEFEYGGVQVMVNNAGIMDDFIPADHLSNELWERVLKVNLYGPFYFCREVLPIMIKKGKGVIINVASVGGIQGCRAGAAYTSSKFGLVGLSKNMAFMYAKKGIRCNVIAPGGVETGIGKDMKPDVFGAERAMSGSSNMLRMGKPEEIASIAVFLASDESALMNGDIVVADGGWTAY
jgi:NAD(P)-dependent dehydrogenase (short-subunit alcohol dehydrogenase family)